MRRVRFLDQSAYCISCITHAGMGNDISVCGAGDTAERVNPIMAVHFATCCKVRDTDCCPLVGLCGDLPF